MVVTYLSVWLHSAVCHLFVCMSSIVHLFVGMFTLFVTLWMSVCLCVVIYPPLFGAWHTYESVLKWTAPSAQCVVSSGLRTVLIFFSFCHPTLSWDSEARSFCVEKCKLKQRKSFGTYTLPRCRRPKGMHVSFVVLHFADLLLCCWKRDCLRRYVQFSACRGWRGVRPAPAPQCP